ncbi:MAG: S8 family serine peptidase, partial [Gammaproteobacteria bacterium]|nr:S8 family serine peptidase [Gammaproteobacteria bacterium]
MTEYGLDYRSSRGDGTDNRHRLVRSSHAWARGATGRGETVVFADSGFFTEHSEFGDKFTLGATFGTPCTPQELASRTCSDDHGTGTAAIAAARRGNGDTTTSGVAFDANIIGLRVRLGAGGGTVPNTGPRDLTDQGDDDNVEFYERLIYRPNAGGSGYDRNNPWGFVINFSFGRPHGVDSYTRADVREFRDRTAALFAQAHRDAADRTIIVWSAGNEYGDRYDIDRNGNGRLDPGEFEAGEAIDATSPTLETALGVHFPELQGHVLTVVAVDQRSGRIGDERIASFSNRCGSAKNFCLAAPGTHMVLARRGICSISSSGAGSCSSSYWASQGTSYAAPMVTGALAVMRQFFRNPPGSPDAGEPALGNTELVARLLATADRTDYSATGGPDYSDSDTYGHGLLDLDAATRPAGMLMASTADGRRVAAESTALEIPRGAFGDAVSHALRDTPLVLFDALDSPFFFTADQLVHAPAPAAAGAELAAAEAAATADAMLLRAGDGQGRRWWFAPKYNSGAGL